MSAAQPLPDQPDSWDQIDDVPANIEVEQQILGALMIDNEGFALVSGVLEDSHFCEPIHRKIFSVLASQIKAGRAANPVTIKPFLPADQTIGEMTVAQYLARLAAEAVTTVNIPDYADQIRDMSVRRRCMEIAEDGRKLFADVRTDLSIYDSMQHVRSQFAELIDGETSSGAGETDIATAFDLVARETSDALDGKGKIGIDTGFSPINVLTGPWAGNQLIVIGGGTKQGKSALAMQCAMGAAKENPVWVYSKEMNYRELTRREIARVTGIAAARMRKNEITSKEMEQIANARSQVYRDKLWIHDKPLTIAQIDDRADRLTSRFGRTLLVIDYIALVAKDRQSWRMSQFEFCEYVTHELKEIAGKYDVPIVALAQLKKNTFEAQYGATFKKRLEAVEGRRPRYADLYGGIERDADHTIIPWNLEPILSQLEPAPDTEDHFLWETAMDRHRGKAKLILALSREAHFPASVDVDWHGPTTSFIDRREDTYGRTMF